MKIPFFFSWTVLVTGEWIRPLSLFILDLYIFIFVSHLERQFELSFSSACREFFVRVKNAKMISSSIFCCLNFTVAWLTLLIRKHFLNLFSKIITWQCFHNKRNKCSHSLPPLHSSKSIVATGSEYPGSFKLLFMTNLREHFRWLVGTFPSLSIRTRALLTQLWNLNFLHLKSFSGLGLGKSI